MINSKRPLPDLQSICERETHVAFLYDPSNEGTCFLGLGARRSLLLGTETPTTKAFEALQTFTGRVNRTWTFGWLGYELKNTVENLQTTVKNPSGLPVLAWWEPEIVIRWTFEEEPEVLQGNVNDLRTIHALEIINSESEIQPRNEGGMEGAKLVWSWNQPTYLRKFEEVKALIQAGEVYELNLCQTLTGKAPSNSSWSLFRSLAEKTQAPFSSYMQCGKFRIMSGSPERFLKRTGNRIISQPIKGTIRRGLTPQEDGKLSKQLADSVKERAENVMIVDLVRNDLSKVAERNSVEVTELCGIHQFHTVHQMISTIECDVDVNRGLSEILKATFPMGSMTGAPKIAAMLEIDNLEKHGRGVYSGSVGYHSPEGNFDLNVLIRSLFHNSETHYLEAAVGGAITSLSNADEEYNECLLKASALIDSVKENIR